MRYAEARMGESERVEIYRVYVAEHLKALVGSDVSYYETAHRIADADFDAGEVVDDVISRMGLEGE